MSVSSSGQSSTSANGYGSSGNHATDADATRADAHHSEPSVVELGHLHHARNGADVGSLVAATDLEATFDEHHPELVLGRLEAVADQLAIARFEHVQRQHGPGQQHAAQREHRHHGHETDCTPSAVRRQRCSRGSVRSSAIVVGRPRSRPSGHVAQQLVDRCRHAVQPPEQHDLAVQPVDLGGRRPTRQALPRRAARPAARAVRRSGGPPSRPDRRERSSSSVALSMPAAARHASASRASAVSSSLAFSGSATSASTELRKVHHQLRVLPAHHVGSRFAGEIAGDERRRDASRWSRRCPSGTGRHRGSRCVARRARRRCPAP